MDAVERGMQMLQIPTKDLPPLAFEFMRKLSRELGLCGETCLTAYAIYAQCVENLPCKDPNYAARPEDFLWFQGKPKMPPGYVDPSSALRGEGVEINYLNWQAKLDAALGEIAELKAVNHKQLTRLLARDVVILDQSQEIAALKAAPKSSIDLGQIMHDRDQAKAGGMTCPQCDGTGWVFKGATPHLDQLCQLMNERDQFKKERDANEADYIRVRKDFGERMVRERERAEKTEADIKSLMNYRVADSCASCRHMGEHPDSYKGGETGPTFRCTANVLFTFIIDTPHHHICDHHSGKAQ